MPVTSMTIYSGPARKKPKAGDTKMIRGVLHVRRQARVEFGPHKGALIVSNSRPVWEWVVASNSAEGAHGEVK